SVSTILASSSSCALSSAERSRKRVTACGNAGSERFGGHTVRLKLLKPSSRMAAQSIIGSSFASSNRRLLVIHDGAFRRTAGRLALGSAASRPFGLFRLSAGASLFFLEHETAGHLGELIERSRADDPHQGL